MNDILTEPWEELARAGDLAGAIESYVKRYDWVTFPEILRRLEPFAEVHGTFAMGHIGMNVWFWVGMSEAFVDALDLLRVEKRLFIHPTSCLTYMVDGGLLKWPLAQKIPKGGYKTEHWTPLCFRVVPMKEKRQKKPVQAPS